MKRPLVVGALCVGLSLSFAACKDETKDDAKAADAKDKKAEGGDAAAKGGEDGAKAADGEKADAAAGDEDKGGIADKVADAAAGAGGAGSGDLVGYIPDGATMVVVLDAKSVFGSSLFKDNREMIEQGEAGEVFKAAGDCKVGPETWQAALIGGEAGSDKKLIVGGQATGIGTKATIECLAAKVNEKQGKEEWKVSEEDGRTVVEIDGGDAKGFSGGDDIFVIAGSDYAGVVKDRLDGKGTAAKDGSLKDALAGADTSKHVYFAGKATPEMAAGPTAGLQHFSGSLDFSSGLKIAASLDFGDEAKAKTTSEMFNKQFEGMKAMAGGFGVPQGIVDSVKIEPAGTAVNASVSASNEDLEKLAALATKQFGAMGGGNMGGM